MLWPERVLFSQRMSPAAVRLHGVYDVWARMAPPAAAGLHSDAVHAPWVSSTCAEVAARVRAELAASPALADKLEACLHENEIDGEVMSTFISLQELCEHMQLPLVLDLASLAPDCQPNSDEDSTAAAARWGQVLADGMLARRLFVRSRAGTTSSALAAFSADDVDAWLQQLVSARLQAAVAGGKPSDTPGSRPSVAEAEEIEALLASAIVVRTARLCGTDLRALAPTEAGCLLPPWLRTRHDASRLILPLLLHLRSIELVGVHAPVGGAGGAAAPGPCQQVMRRLPLSVPPTTIVVLGNTGAGKSTLLNAFLGEVALLPTNAMRACTASIIEVEFNAQPRPGAEYRAEIEYLSAEEWRQQVRDAFHLVLAASNANADSDSSKAAPATREGVQGPSKEENGVLVAPEEETAAREAWDKMQAAYGSSMRWTSAENLLCNACENQSSSVQAAADRIHRSLGTTFEVTASSGTALCEGYSKCVDSVNDGAQGSLWPIVKRVVLRGPWPVLAHAVRLVDAPGLADDNSARDAMVKRVLEQANSVWLVSNIRRAVNDKTTKDMMPPAFKQALLERGVLGSLVFVATHSDVLIRSEVVENLNLPHESSLLSCAQARNDFFRNKLACDFNRGVLADPGQSIPPDTSTRGSQPHNSKPLIKTDEEIARMCASEGARQAEAMSVLRAATELTPAQREVLTHFLSEQGRLDMSHMKQLAASPCPAGASFELASFAVSAVDFQKLAGLRIGDGAPSVFASMEHTQVPALQRLVVATSSIQRLSPFKAGAELVRCLQEAKEAAQREEDEMMREDADEPQKQNVCRACGSAADSCQCGAGASSLSKGVANCRYCRHTHWNLQATVESTGLCTMTAKDRSRQHEVCRYCRSLVLPGIGRIVCGDGSMIHSRCLDNFKQHLRAGSQCMVDCPKVGNSENQVPEALHGQLVTLFAKPNADNTVKIEAKHTKKHEQSSKMKVWFLRPVYTGRSVGVSAMLQREQVCTASKLPPQATVPNPNASVGAPRAAHAQALLAAARAIAGGGKRTLEQAEGMPGQPGPANTAEERRLRRKGVQGGDAGGGKGKGSSGEVYIDLTGDSPPGSPRAAGSGSRGLNSGGGAAPAVLDLCSTDDES